MKYLFTILCIVLSIHTYAQKAPVTVKSSIQQEQQQNTAGVYNAPEKKAYFVYGQDSLDRYIKRNMHFNDAGDEAAGKAVVVFIVEKDGSIGTAEILHTSVNKDFDKEAVRVVKTIPQWQPAKDKGNVVRSSAMLSVAYQVRQ